MDSIRHLKLVCLNGRLLLNSDNIFLFTEYISKENIIEAMAKPTDIEYERLLAEERMRKLTEV